MTTVLLADDHAAVRAGLSMLFDATPDIRVVATCTDGDEVVGAAERTRPDVVLMDLRMRRVDGLTATRLLLAAQPGARVVVLTGSPSRDVVLGARGQRLEWAGSFEELGPEHFQALADLGVEVVIFGSGPRIRFPKPAWLAPLGTRRIGIETMDTAAACRTYNILAQEGRDVAVALLLDNPG